MVYGIYQSAAGLQLNQYRQDVLANNLANVGTVGFKHDLSVVGERMIAAREEMAGANFSDPQLNNLSGGSLVSPTYTAFVQGPLEESGKPLDVALVGDGFFAVHDGNGERYTRDGRFTLNAEGELVTVAGNHRVLDEQGQPITVPPAEAGQAKFGADGVLRAGPSSFGKLKMIDFEDKNRLRKIGGNMFQAAEAKPTAAHASVRVGMVEQSTVDAMQNMVAMIEVTRAYQLNATLIGLADATLGRAVNDIAQVR